MSPTVGSSRIASRAKCKRSNCPNGKIGLAGSAIPGFEFIVASSSRRPRSRPGVTGASTMNWDCGVTASELQARAQPLVPRSEEHTSELQSLRHLVCRLLLEKKKKKNKEKCINKN